MMHCEGLPLRRWPNIEPALDHHHVCWEGVHRVLTSPDKSTMLAQSCTSIDDAGTTLGQHCPGIAD